MRKMSQAEALDADPAGGKGDGQAGGDTDKPAKIAAEAAKEPHHQQDARQHDAAQADRERVATGRILPGGADGRAATAGPTSIPGYRPSELDRRARLRRRRLCGFHFCPSRGQDIGVGQQLMHRFGGDGQAQHLAATLGDLGTEAHPL